MEPPRIPAFNLATALSLGLLLPVVAGPAHAEANAIDQDLINKVVSYYDINKNRSDRKYECNWYRVLIAFEVNELPEGLDGNSSSGQQFEAELAYGFSAHHDRLTITPAVAMALSSTSRNYSFLWSVAPYAQQAEGEPWQLSLQGERQEENGATPVEHSLELTFSTPFRGKLPCGPSIPRIGPIITIPYGRQTLS